MSHRVVMNCDELYLDYFWMIGKPKAPLAFLLTISSLSTPCLHVEENYIFVRCFTVFNEISLL